MLNQKKISWWRTTFNEEDIDSVSNAIRDEKMSQGSVTRQFETELQEKLNVPFAIATTSGSVAILMTLMAIGIKPGDEVIIPNRTWIAAVHAVLILGGKPIIIDVVKEIPIMNTSQIEQYITRKTRVIIPTQLSGRAVDMDVVWALAKKHNLIVLEDSAQALFSKYKEKFMGTQSDFGCFSLSVAKLLPTGQGGVVVTKSKENYEKLLRIRTHGVTNFTKFVPFETLGFNFRFNDVLASIGIVRLRNIDDKIKKIKKIYQLYENSICDLKSIKIVPINVDTGEVPLYIEVLSSDRSRLIDYLYTKGIETRTFYPDLNSAKYLKTNNRFPNSKIFSDCGFVLPCGPDQPIEDIERTITELRNYEAL